MLVEQLLRIIAGLFVGILVARHLGPERFGLFSYVLAYTAIFAGIAKLGLDSIIVRELVTNSDKLETILGTAFWLKMFSAFIVIVLIAASVRFASNDGKTNMYILIISAGLFFQSFDVVEFYFQSQVLAKIISICKIIQLALSSIIKLYLMHVKADFFWFVFVATFDVLSLAVGYFIAYIISNNPVFYKCFDFSTAKQLLKDSWPLMVSMLMVTIYMKIDQVMIKEMLGDHELGQYSVGIRLVEAIYFLPTVVVSSLFPAILNAKKSSAILYEKRLIRLFSFLMLLSIPIMLVLCLGSGLIINLLFGSAYASAHQVLSIYALSIPFVFLAVASSRWFVAENIQKYLLVRASLAAIINISLNYILIKMCGINGAAIATVLTYCFVAVISDLFSVKTLVLAKYKLRSLYLGGYYDN